MEECAHCGESFADEDAYLSHLASTHRDDLGAIEERRVAEYEADGDGGVPTSLYAAVGVVGLLLAVAGYALLSGGGGGDGRTLAQEATSPMAGGGSVPAPAQDPVAAPRNYGATHEHGTMAVVVDGTRLDFSRPQYQVQADAFHFEERNGREYHLHADRVSLEYALETLDIGVTEHTLSYQETVYDDREDGVTVTYRVNGEPVDPEHTLLGSGDTVEVVVTVEGGGTTTA
jgi:sulfur carrier protein ThiS